MFTFLSNGMWLTILMLLLISSTHCLSFSPKNKISMFKNEQIVFSSNYNITRLLVPADTSKFEGDSSDIPSIFFAIADPHLEGGSCVYVLEGFAAYEILEGGRDITADYSADKNIYIGAKDGIYKYDSDSLSTKKYCSFQDDITQLQKANGSDTIYILTSERKVYKIEKSGTIRTRVKTISCAVEFVLDTSNNIYYISCYDNMPHIVKSDGSLLSVTASVLEDFKEIKLLRPAFIMDDCIPFFGDNNLYILYANGTSEKKDFALNDKPSAYSVDAALYLVAAMDGKIYEFNVMEVLLKSMFGLGEDYPRDVTKIVMSIIENAKEGLHAVANLI